MELLKDADRFDHAQPWFVGEIIERVKRDLEEGGLKGEALKNLCGNIAFSVCALIDGAAEFEADGVGLVSYLAFSERDDMMFYPGDNSNLHEYVFGVLDEIFEDDA
ncbi:MAG: hypothetical protein P8Y95_18420 [Gammaproteobacteria bacterium]|jgi:hypothetical protein